MKLLKNKWFWLVVTVLGIFVIGVLVSLSGGEKQEFVLAGVERGNLIQTVDASGELESVEKVDLAFETSGTVDEINSQVGDLVEKGDVIAVLEAADLKAEVRGSEQQLTIASAKLSQELAGATNESIAVVFAGVSIAEASLEAAEIDLVNTRIIEGTNVSEALVNLETESDDLANVQAKNILNLRESREDYVNALKSAIIDVRATMADADEVLGIENNIINDDYQNYLSALEPNRMDHATTAFNLAKAARDDAEEIVFDLSADSADLEIDTGAALAEEALHQTSKMLLHTRQVLDATTANTADFTTADLLSLKSSIDTARNTIQTEESSFFSSKQSFLSSTIDADTAEDNAVNALSRARQAYDRSVSNQTSKTSIASSTIAMRAAELERAEASLTEIEANPRIVDLASFRADVARAQANLDASRARLAKAEITSPIAGRITSIDIEQGEQIGSNTPVVIVQTTDDDQFKVVVSVAESDIAKVALRDKTEITFDAFGEGIKFTGTVGSIDPAQNETEGVVFYEVDVFFSEVDLADLKPGMSVDVTMETENRPDVLFVARRAVLEHDDGTKYVRIKKGSSFVERDVQTGLQADGGKLEILSGLEEGEEIIISIR